MATVQLSSSSVKITGDSKVQLVSPSITNLTLKCSSISATATAECGFVADNGKLYLHRETSQNWSFTFPHDDPPDCVASGSESYVDQYPGPHYTCSDDNE